MSNLSKEEISSKSFEQLMEDHKDSFYSLGVCLDHIKDNKNKNWYKDETIISNVWGSKALLLKNALDKIYTKKEIKTITLKQITDLIWALGAYLDHVEGNKNGIKIIINN